MSTQNTDPRNNPRSRDFESSINTRPATNDEIAYRDGYVRGKSAEQLEQERRRAAEARIYEENARLQADRGISTGLILGLALAALAAVVGGLIYVYLEETDPGTAVPTPEAVTPEPTNNETTIIERTVERAQEVIPAPSSAQPPEVDVDLNNATEPTLAPAAPSQPEASTNETLVEPAQPADGSN
ncbi:hypothetical protein IQ273_30495 [Nodosilinea sp. LEGE 07298]|uniref:hypothetical protein n=1 Tax=Nodosilinea sp. LEGE 07298 TaxID=2777970 RepID=UPI0018830071|nr:hypothetical protein [Nodosilinea sp. LEGE 07298]MBE9113706.1 hypothetical protein [Nodosilinea sp. LEGE 07298]